MSMHKVNSNFLTKESSLQHFSSLMKLKSNQLKMKEPAVTDWKYNLAFSAFIFMVFKKFGEVKVRGQSKLFLWNPMQSK